jgi:hypothetical protein
MNRRDVPPERLYNTLNLSTYIAKSSGKVPAERLYNTLNLLTYIAKSLRKYAMPNPKSKIRSALLQKFYIG